jgi:hypothetical protein
MPSKASAYINVEKLIEDCGGVQTVSQVTGIQRTNVYSIIKRRRMNTEQLASILAVFGNINIRDYLVK